MVAYLLWLDRGWTICILSCGFVLLASVYDLKSEFQSLDSLKVYRRF